MFTHAKNYLLTAATIVTLVPITANAEDSDYDYWRKGATAGIAGDDPSYSRSDQAGSTRSLHHYANGNRMQAARSNMDNPRYDPANGNTRGWTYEYDYD